MSRSTLLFLCALLAAPLFAAEEGGDAVEGDAPAAEGGDSAETEAEEASDPVSRAQIDGYFAKLGNATTSAQVFLWQKRALERITGAPITLTFTVTDVKPVVLKGEEMFAVEGANHDPEYQIVFYTAEEDAVLAIDREEEITMAGTGQGFFYGRGKKKVAVEKARLVEEPADEVVTEVEVEVEEPIETGE